jgi:protein disulfide isomerase
MRIGLFVITISLCVLAVLSSDVVDAKDSDFDAVVSQSELVLVEFYAPWCGHCKKLAPEWEKAASEVKGQAVLAKVDATVETKMAEKYEIQGYPTIKVFREGQLAGDYSGGRTAEAIVSYVKNNLGPAVSLLSDASSLASLKEENTLSVVGFTANAETAVGKVLHRVASILRNDFKFGMVTDATLAAGEAMETIVVFKSFDEGRHVYDGPLEPAALEKFISTTSVRNFDEIGPDNYRSYVALGKPIGWLFMRPSNADDVAIRESIEPLGAEFKDGVAMVWIDADKYSGMAERMAIDGFPGFVIAHGEEKYVFPKEQPLTTQNVRDFLRQFLDNKLEKTMRTQPAPEKHTNDLGLTTVVGSSFDELVLGREVDVLVEFYAPWCGHCKQLQPTYQQLAKELRKVEGIRVAQIDASANDFNTELFSVQGFPTIYFVPRSGEPVLYEGERSVVGMMAFIKEHSTVTFDIPEKPNAEEHSEL